MKFRKLPLPLVRAVLGKEFYLMFRWFNEARFQRTSPGFATFYPATRLLGRPEFRIYAPLIPLVAAATFALAATSWRIGLRRYSSTGS